MDDANYRLALVVKAGHDGQTIMMACNGDNNFEPCFDAPAGLTGFTKGNGDFTTSTSICTDYVISVGSYITRNVWQTYRNTIAWYPASKMTGQRQQLGEISDFSSYGIDDNGKLRPTLLAPGMGIISGANNYDNNMFLVNAPGTVDDSNSSQFLCSYVEKHGRCRLVPVRMWR